jgi:hypothetical protein
MRDRLSPVAQARVRDDEPIEWISRESDFARFFKPCG